MNAEEIEVKIKEEKAKLVILEEAYEKEENENKQQVLWGRAEWKEKEIDRLIDRQQVLLDKEEGSKEKDKNAEEEDTDVCPECGGDLVLVGKDDSGVTDVYECEKCGELFLDE